MELTWFWEFYIIQNFILMLMLQVADPEIRPGESWGGVERKDRNADRGQEERRG